MTLHWPQLVILGLMAMSTGIAISRFGEQKRDNYDWTDVLISPALTVFLLWKGGFFS